MTDFRFIADEQIRATIERDKKELDNCLEHQLYKSALILAGSIIEAILVDYFLVFPRQNFTNEQILRATLSDLIDWAAEDDLITKQTKELSTVIREYRNLIHPGKEYRLKERVDVYTANVASNLLEIIAREISENYAKKLGYTAEQAIHKVQLDPTSTAIFPHIIKKMSPTEREKLFKRIPIICISGEVTDTTINSLMELHQALKKHIRQDTWSMEVLCAYDYVHNNKQKDALFYLRFFSGDLDLLESDQKDSVMVYLLNIFETGDEECLSYLYDWQIFRPMSKFFNDEEEQKRLRKYIDQRLEKSPSTGDDEFLKILCDHILVSVDYGYIETLIKDLSKKFRRTSAKTWSEFISENYPF